MKALYQKRWIRVILLLSCLGMLGLSGCKDLFSGSDRDDDSISGLFALTGKEIVTTYSDWPIPENDVPSVDTTRIRFLMLTNSVPKEENMVRLYGLEGADVGKRERYLYPGCDTPNDCKITGTLDGEILTIELYNNGRSYQAEGAIRNVTDGNNRSNYVVITATYHYQHTTIQYEIEGGVIIE